MKAEEEETSPKAERAIVTELNAWLSSLMFTDYEEFAQLLDQMVRGGGSCKNQRTSVYLASW